MSTVPTPTALTSSAPQSTVPAPTGPASAVPTSAVPTPAVPTSAVPTSTALLTDHYELTMLQAALRSGMAGRRAVFEVFTRSLPAGRRFGVLAGTGRLLAAIEQFRFGPRETEHLRSTGVVDDRTVDWLAGYRFGGDIHGFAEGEPFLPGTPVLVVEGTFAECVLLETLVLSVLNHDSAVAAAGARMVAAAGDRPCLEMGGRRTHEQAAVAAARAAYIVGFAGTSNLEAARGYGVPSAGTSAHAFTLVHDDETAAFAAQVAALGAGTTLLVDTYDITTGIANAVAAAGTGLGAIRIDSGDLAAGARAARAQLDALGAVTTRIVVTGDLDEHAIARLAAAPVDSYGVGTSLVTGSGAPTAGFVYKLVEADGRPVAKTSIGKGTRGGRKEIVRRFGPDGSAVADVIIPGGEWPGAARARGAAPAAPANAADPADAADPAARAAPADRPLLVPLMRAGAVVAETLVGAAGVTRARDHHRAALASLPAAARDVRYGQPCLPVVVAGDGTRPVS
ncbi:MULTISPECIES: nicotinate phosphoribosyltransferase [Parafrankia]|nr:MULTISPECIES: nicotinate phosphoribosyltransferase [Parafrankia]